MCDTFPLCVTCRRLCSTRRRRAYTPRPMNILRSGLASCALLTTASASAFATVDLPGAALERAFENLRFERPIFLTGAGDGSGRVFVVEQGGVVRVFDGAEDARETEVFLDLSDVVSRRGNEEGLLGLAFHPDFADNGQVFAHFSSERDPGKNGVAQNVISRFTVDPKSPNPVDPDTEEMLLVQRQPFRNHNGGMIAFGPDGMLYASLGDGGAANDPEGNGQKLSSMLGSIIRIDVDRKDEGLAYGIPEDNPFASPGGAYAGVEGARPEIYALGLRNVWRFGFDRETGELYAADVGQNRIEEVDKIVSGGNYGWNRYEAEDDFAKDTALAPGRLIEPIASYPHSDGLSITGGYVYRGSRQPSLDGVYFFADYASGNLWGLRETEDNTYESELVRRTGRSIASFGEDDGGELFALSFDGGVYRVVAAEPMEPLLAHWPEKLSDTGLYASTRKGKLAEHLVPYEVNAPFWSDNAEKGRYFELPEGKALTFTSEDSFEVPVGTRIVKTFHQPPAGRRRNPRPVETRVIVRTEDGWDAGTYLWDGRGRDAVLVPDGRQFEQWGRSGVTTWHAPSSSECASCHTAESGFVLGLSAPQLAGGEGEDSQLLRWLREGVLEVPEGVDVTEVAAHPDPFDESAPLEDRARAYLDVNCAMCHRPNGPGNASIDLRSTTGLADTGMIDVAPGQGHMGLENARIVAPGAPERSVLLERIRTLGSGRMPSIGSHVVDEAGVELLVQWIQDL